MIFFVNRILQFQNNQKKYKKTGLKIEFNKSRLIFKFKELAFLFTTGWSRQYGRRKIIAHQWTLFVKDLIPPLPTNRSRFAGNLIFGHEFLTFCFKRSYA